MTTSLAGDVRNEHWTDPEVAPGVNPIWARAQVPLLTLLSLALLGGFLLFVIDGYPLRTLIAVQ